MKWIEERTYIECPNCHDIWHYEKNQTERFKFCPTCGNKCVKDKTQKSLCDSCITKGCIFQSGIVRTRCVFYKSESKPQERNGEVEDF